MYEAKRRYAFRSYFCYYFYSYIQVFQSKPVTKKIVKVVEDGIYDKLSEIYKVTEKIVLAKFVEAIPFSGSHCFQLKVLFLFETIFFQQKQFLLVESIPFSGSHSFLVLAIPFSVIHSFQWNSFLLVETILFSGSHSFQWKSFLLVETIPFSGSHSFY